MWDTNKAAGRHAHFAMGLYIALEFITNTVLYSLVWAKLKKVESRTHCSADRVHHRVAMVSVIH